MTTVRRIAILVLFAVVILLLWVGRVAREGAGPEGGPAVPDTAAVAWSEEPEPTAAELESAAQDRAWREAASVDSVAAPPPAAAPHRETWRELRRALDAWAAAVRDSARAPEVTLPLYGEVPGPSILYLQVLLDRARFSPGILDGRWGQNTEKAVLWFQHALGLPATGAVDSTTFEALVDRADHPRRYVARHVLTDDEVAGPFVAIPSDVYAQARLRCLCYTSLAEKLGERFHAAPEILSRLNPGTALDSLAAGDTLLVPAVDVERADSMAVARLAISDRGGYLHGLDEEGRVLFHLPVTLGSTYDPSPQGDYHVTSITADPWFYYQPALLAGGDPSKPTTRLPPGPNSPVGVVWIALSAPHYGIHGTREPAGIGYATSSGCVRLTNWDARFLSALVRPATPVEFRDLAPAEPAVPPDSVLAGSR